MAPARDTTWTHEPEGAPIENQGLGWSSAYKTGIAGDAITSGLEVTWTTKPRQWTNDYFDHLFKYEWELTKSPGGAHQWKPKGDAGREHCARRARSEQEASAGHADHGRRSARGSGLREDLARLLRQTLTSLPMPLRGRGSS